MAVTLSPLDRADGSASYSSNGYTVICGVNGPIEVQRRDELPEEAAIEVNIRPAYGVGGIRERHLESIVLAALRRIILLSVHPRTLIQVTLQVVASQEDEEQISGLPQAASNLSLLPSLLQAAMLALLSTSLPLTMTLSSTLIAIDDTGELLQDPSAKGLVEAASLHVLAFSSRGDLLLAESEGEFSMDQWESMHQKAYEICLGIGDQGVDGDDTEMQGGGQAESLQCKLRSIVQEKAEAEQRWKADLG